MSIHPALALAFAAYLIGCSSPAKAERKELIQHYQRLEAQVPTIVVDASDGISEAEAYKVARDYFASSLSVCGAVGLPQEENAIWRVPVLEGIAGRHTKDVIVKKRDGSCSIVAATSK